MSHGITENDLLTTYKVLRWYFQALVAILCITPCQLLQSKNGARGPMSWTQQKGRIRSSYALRNNLVLHRIRAAERQNATCMDGSNAMFYLDRNVQSEHWIIHLQAGGSCVTQEECIHRENGPLGSSLFLKTFMTGKLSLSRSRTTNPTFYNWNKVFIPYCSGDVFVGRMPKWKHPFRIPMLGHYIVVAVIRQLIMDYPIKRPGTRILFGGTSAGGLGTMANIDFIQKMTHPAKVRGYNDGGWFTLFPNYGEKFFDPGLPKFFNVLTELFDNYWRGFVDESCRAQMPKAAACLYGELAMKHISTPMYVMVARWDSYQLTKLIASDYRPVSLPPKRKKEKEYVSLFGNNTRRSLQMVKKKGKSGVFSPACYSHTFLTSCIDGNICQYPPSDTFQINGKNAYQAMSEWYTSDGTKGTYIEESRSVPSCNPSCCSLLCYKCKLPPLPVVEKQARKKHKTTNTDRQREGRKATVFFYSNEASGLKRRVNGCLVLVAITILWTK